MPTIGALSATSQNLYQLLQKTTPGSSTQTDATANSQDAAVASAISGANATLMNSQAELLSGSASRAAASGNASGFDAAIGLGANLAMTAYTNQQNGIRNATPAEAAQASGSSTAESPAAIQSAIQSAQASLLSNTLNLLA